MHKIGIQSIGAIPVKFDDTQIYETKELADAYRNLKEAGIDCIDLGFDEYLNCNRATEGNVDKFLNRPIEELWKDFSIHAKLAKENGITFEQMHAPFPVWQKDKPEVNEIMTRIVSNTIELCARMGGKYIVVHPVTLAYDYGKQEEHDFNIEMYKTFIPVARKCKVTICLENLFLERNGHLCEGVCSDIQEAVDMIDELNAFAGEELFGFCYDVGHANILGKNLCKSVTTLGNRLKILHIHDNDGVSDLHSMPFTFCRSWFGLSTDWDGFLRGLREIGYQGVLNFEVFRCMQSFPSELHPALMKLFADMGHYFSERI